NIIGLPSIFCAFTFFFVGIIHNQIWVFFGYECPFFPSFVIVDFVKKHFTGSLNGQVFFHMISPIKSSHINGKTNDSDKENKKKVFQYFHNSWGLCQEAKIMIL